MTEIIYIAVKASLYATDSSVFGLQPEEYSALCKRFPETSKEVINGVLIKAPPLAVINSLSELGYRVVCSSGEAEIVWTLRREALGAKDDRLSAKVVTAAGRPVTDQDDRLSPKIVTAAGRPVIDQDDRLTAKVVMAAGRPVVVQPKIPRQEVKPVDKIGGKPEDLNEYADPDRIYLKNLSSLENVPPDQKVILKTNISSENNPLSKRTAQPAASQAQGAPTRANALVHPLSPEHQKMSTHAHSPTNPSVTQTLDEMDFERGLWYPAVMGDERRLDELLSKGIHPDMADKSGYTALHYASRNGDAGIVKKLINAGASVNVRTKAGNATPLHRAAGAGKDDIVQLLINAGADKIPRDAEGRTPLHRAVEGGHEKTVIFLLRSAPEAASVVDDKGMTPLALAKNPSMKTIIEGHLNGVKKPSTPTAARAPLAR